MTESKEIGPHRRGRDARWPLTLSHKPVTRSRCDRLVTVRDLTRLCGRLYWLLGPQSGTASLETLNVCSAAVFVFHAKTSSRSSCAGHAYSDIRCQSLRTTPSSSRGHRQSDISTCAPLQGTQRPSLIRSVCSFCGTDSTRSMNRSHSQKPSRWLLQSRPWRPYNYQMPLAFCVPRGVRTKTCCLFSPVWLTRRR